MKFFIRQKMLILLILLTITLLYNNKSFGQYLEKDRVSLINGQSFNGIIIQDHKPDYLIIQSEDFGQLKIKYSLIARTFRKANLEEPFYKNLGHQYISISVGAGHSYGGYGVRFQQRVGRKVGFAYSVGMGLFQYKDYSYEYNGSDYARDYYQANSIGISIAAKLYAYKWFYAQLGILITPEEYYEPYPFTMIGYDLAINRLLSLNAGIGITSKENLIFQLEWFTFDFGMMFRFPTPKRPIR